MRALVLSDIHANLEALQAVLASAHGLYDQIWNLGDIVGYGASPNQVIDLIRPLSTLIVRGNHDRVSCGLTSPNSFNPVARAAVLWTRANLTSAHTAWLRELPQGPLHPSCPDISCAHGSPLDEDHYIVNMRDAWFPLQRMPTAITFFGHTHLQGGFSQREHNWHELRPHFALSAFRQQAARNQTQAELLSQLHSQPQSHTLTLAPNTRYLINPGSVGQPRDHDWRAAYALYTCPDHDPANTSESDGAPVITEPHPPAESPTLTFHRIPYDLAASQARILAAGLPERLATRLREGR